MKNINYKCPECGGKEVEIILIDACVSQTILGWDEENGMAVVGPPKIEDYDENARYQCKKCGYSLLCANDDEFFDIIEDDLDDDDGFDPSMAILDEDEVLVKLNDGDSIMVDGAFLIWNEALKHFSYSHMSGEPSFYKDGAPINYLGHGRYSIDKEYIDFQNNENKKDEYHDED